MSHFNVPLTIRPLWVVRMKFVVACFLMMGTVAVASPPKPDLTQDPKAPDEPQPTKKTVTPLEVKGPWYTGPYARNREYNLAFTGALGLYLGAASLFNFTPIPSKCSWCSVPGFDAGARHQLKWNNTGLADTISSYEAYVLAPIVGLTLLIVADSDASPTRLIDDVLPVAETVAVTEVLTSFAKYGFARERPYAHYASTPTSGGDADVSFWSGHSVLGFSITGAAATICHFRHYKTEPYVWATGIALSLSVEYLRIAADKHYLSDVITGGLVGIGAGLLVPRLMQREVKIVPVRSTMVEGDSVNGVALAGSF